MSDPPTGESERGTEATRAGVNAVLDGLVADIRQALDDAKYDFSGVLERALRDAADRVAAQREAGESASAP